ncbi:hypothetical protein [Cohnella thailandensis]|uniref:Uncharacterized protein n=1 Tax=Cohnella thailandensis TaxID=557557 RepID=A0A841SXU3_9BACL|nr:hypothetical protein [Cohnella thailandensis]MBB6634427.1 hypothetical protein [Cohnella thailandensis]MBP1972073.1 uncharacterized membrane protein YidH (DUF202 family) [Cohnella thailandensis]
MRKGIVAIALSVLTVVLAVYRWRALNQPKVGPVGNGNGYPRIVYAALVLQIVVGVCAFVIGIVLMARDIRNNRPK